MSNHDKYLDPPDEPEAELCEECGQEKEEIDSFMGMRDMVCVNPFCPLKFQGVEQEMAYELVQVKQDLETARWRLRNMGYPKLS